MIKLNMRGLQTELIAMQAERKILEKELILAERAVEKQLAAYLSIKNRSQEMLNQAMYAGIKANAIPDITATHLEKMGDEFVETGYFMEGGSGTGEVNLDGITVRAFKGFGAEMDGYIKEAAAMFGIDEKTLRGFVKMEGGRTGEVSSAGATGVGQFTHATWQWLSRTADGRAIGMKLITGTSPGDKNPPKNDPRFDRRVSTLATALLMRNNMRDLERRKIPATPENLYMMHNMGPAFVYQIYGIRQKNYSPATMYSHMAKNGGGGMTPQKFNEFQKKRFAQHDADANNVSGSN